METTVGGVVLSGLSRGFGCGQPQVLTFTKFSKISLLPITFILLYLSLSLIPIITSESQLPTSTKNFLKFPFLSLI